MRIAAWRYPDEAAEEEDDDDEAEVESARFVFAAAAQNRFADDLAKNIVAK